MFQHTVGFAERDSLSTYTRVTLSILRWVPKLGTNIISSIKASSRTVLAVMAKFAEGAEQSADVIKGCE